MFLQTKLFLIQGQAGYRPGDSEFLKNRKYIIIKLQATYVGPTEIQPYEFMRDSMGTMPLMGKYQIETTDNGNDDSYVLGLTDAKDKKIWQYDHEAKIVRFGSWEKRTGTPDSNNQNTFNIRPDVELSNAFLTARGFIPNGGWNGYGYGIVKKASYTNKPFEDRPFFWSDHTG